MDLTRAEIHALKQDLICYATHYAITYYAIISYYELYHFICVI